MKATTVYEPSYSVREFCEAEGFSIPHFYKLRADGLGPKEMRTGRHCVRISHRARIEWQTKIESMDQHEHRERASRKGINAVAARRSS